MGIMRSKSGLKGLTNGFSFGLDRAMQWWHKKLPSDEQFLRLRDQCPDVKIFESKDHIRLEIPAQGEPLNLFKKSLDQMWCSEGKCAYSRDRQKKLPQKLRDVINQ